MRPKPSTLWCLFALAACGGDAATGPGTTTELDAIVRHTISGQVTVLKETGLPEVMVELSGAGRVDSTATDGAGWFAFDHLPNGTFTLLVSDLPENVRLEERSQSITMSDATSDIGDTVHVSFDAAYVPVEITGQASQPTIAYVGLAYVDTLVAQGGDEHYTWSIGEGALPEGLELDAATGVIHGEPTAYGQWAFTVEVTSGDGQSDRAPLALNLILHPEAHCGAHPNEAIASFEDPDLEELVRESLGLEEQEDLTCAGLREVTALSNLDAEISHLQGIQNLTNLARLVLSSAHLSDLGPLSGLTSLTWLELKFGRLLGEGALTDISPLAELKNLTHLVLSHNSIRDVSPLGGLTALEGLSLFANEVADIGPLSRLTALEDVRLSHNDISDLTPLGGLTKLRRLGLAGNEVRDAQVLAELGLLEHLDLAENAITDLAPLTRLPLKHLTIGSNGITDMGPLAALEGLEFLSLGGNPIRDLDALSGLAQLTRLYVRNLPIHDIGPLAGLTRLRALDFGENSNITTFEPLIGLTQLRTFVLRENPHFSTLDVLGGARAMIFLDLRGADLADVEALETFHGLSELTLSRNPRITSIQPLIDNPGLGAGVRVWLEGTGVDCDAVEELEARGVTVWSDCAAA